MREEFGKLRYISCIGHLVNGIGKACEGLHDFKVSSKVENARKLPNDEKKWEADFDDQEI